MWREFGGFCVRKADLGGGGHEAPPWIKEANHSGLQTLYASISIYFTLLTRATYFSTRPLYYQLIAIMCSIVYTTIYCRRCGKYLGNNEETRMCASGRRRGQGYHRRLESKNETYHSNWTNCPACEHEYEVYMYSRQQGIPYPRPNPPFN
ncbi:uncharacterized protein FRV6_16373 [Fusarium oxysporum]|uniref:Uncharacterized protein n=1 Tax=Fusarium oxysporum TaxID=5507 RepID=A0A2H3TX85_FUSOX|nr:uncharacterized protein FRV6_16373 [Fusarium oxysporum]